MRKKMYLTIIECTQYRTKVNACLNLQDSMLTGQIIDV